MSDTNELRAVKLTKAQSIELRKLDRDPKYGSSDRDRDKARTVLKRLGCIRFDRKAWEWVITPSGRALLSTSDARAPSVEEGRLG